MWGSLAGWLWPGICPGLFELLVSSLLTRGLSTAHSHPCGAGGSCPHFAFLPFFFMGMVLIPVSCTVSQTSIHRSSLLNLFLTSTV